MIDHLCLKYYSLEVLNIAYIILWSLIQLFKQKVFDDLSGCLSEPNISDPTAVKLYNV